MQNIYHTMYHAPKPEGIENRKAYIVGGGIAGLAAAAFLVDDAHMPGENITIYEAAPTMGGSMDAFSRDFGYQCRGERELEPNMECLWYLCSKIPSLENEGRTVLDDVVDFNKDEPIHSECRMLVNQGHIYTKINDFKMSTQSQRDIQRLFATPESELEDMSIEEFFGKDSDFFESSLWLCFHSMLAFKPYHSAMEAKRYWQRFALACRIDYLEGIVHTKYNEYDAIIKPIEVWLEVHGVHFVPNASVYDLEMDAPCNTVTGIRLRLNGAEQQIGVRTEDMVFVTNGSMSQNCCYGDNKTVAATNRDTKDRGCFTLWENLARKNEKFGHPEKFISDIDKTKWVSFFPTIKGYPQFVQRLEKLTGSKAGTGGAVTIKDSSWDISIILHHKPFYPDQADDEEVFWGYGLFGENVGDYVKKPMCECTGEEIMTELLYHLNLLDMKDEVLSHSYISTCMMPYITSQFMPRKVSDRPRNVPEGCTNLGFIGQYVEIPGDVVFTVETSVRTGLEAVYKLTKLDREIIPVNQTKYDIRYVVDRMRKFAGAFDRPITEDDLPKVNPMKLMGAREKVLRRINAVPHYDYMYTGRDRTVPERGNILFPEYPRDDA